MKIINKQIEMIAQTSKNGTIKPLRFRITENEVLKVVFIKRVTQTEDIRVGNSVARRFMCDIEINGNMRKCEIIYVLDTMIWYLYKM